MAEGGPEPYDEDRYRWLVPKWVTMVPRPADTGGWWGWALGLLVVVLAVWVLWRIAVELWYLALPGLVVVWFLADRWWRSRWAAEQARRRRLGELSWTAGQLDAMTWREFELAIRDLMRRDGIAAEHVGKPGDFSGDVIGRDPVLGETWMVQVKHYGPKSFVGSGEVQKVNGSAEPVYGARLKVVVTTNAFTRQARDFAARAGVHLMDRHDLIRWAGRGAHLHEVLGIRPRTRRDES